MCFQTISRWVRAMAGGLRVIRCLPNHFPLPLPRLHPGASAVAVGGTVEEAVVVVEVVLRGTSTTSTTPLDCTRTPSAGHCLQRFFTRATFLPRSGRVAIRRQECAQDQLHQVHEFCSAEFCQTFVRCVSSPFLDFDWDVCNRLTREIHRRSQIWTCASNRALQDTAAQTCSNVHRIVLTQNKSSHSTRALQDTDTVHLSRALQDTARHTCVHIAECIREPD